MVARTKSQPAKTITTGLSQEQRHKPEAPRKGNGHLRGRFRLVGEFVSAKPSRCKNAFAFITPLPLRGASQTAAFPVRTFLRSCVPVARVTSWSEKRPVELATRVPGALG